MEFKHPEILYALFLLIIPVIVHLFQLQRFVKVSFTNVNLLKQLEFQTRKSSKLKKWLVLCTRMLLFTAIILAFAQPFFSNKEQGKETQNVVYLDNSLSMKAKGTKGELLKSGIKVLSEQNLFDGNYTLITNNNVYENPKDALLEIDYSSENGNLETALLRANSIFKKKSNTQKNLILISDFQKNLRSENIVIDSTFSTSFVQLQPIQNVNISIDSLYLAEKSALNFQIKIKAKSSELVENPVSIALYNNEKLLGKHATDFSKEKEKIIDFIIPKDEEIQGIVKIQYEDVPFDNTYYFSIQSPEKINVLSIGKDEKFVKDLFSSDEFTFNAKEKSFFDLGTILHQNLIVLNELDTVQNALLDALKEFQKQGGSLVVIPSEKSFTTNKKIAERLDLGTLNPAKEKELKLTKIHYEHPIFKNVFDGRISNFEYPFSKKQFTLNGIGLSKILSNEDNSAFVVEKKSEKGNTFWFTSPISNENSNFTQSAIIVPLFYNIAMQSLKVPSLAYTIGNENEVDIKTKIEKNELLKIKNETSEFIPQQQTFASKVKIQLDENPETAGFYTVSKGEEKLNTLAFNYNNAESDLTYEDINTTINNNKNAVFYDSIENAVIGLKSDVKDNWIYKWLLIAAFLFIILEILILKYFKT
ncbi:vWA domain-containing protein [Aureivirga marina]|uniref:vWA domain-containing protein n=1 Tax=Aureivirga marina TaxID=1182451 RepID=UPI0018CA99F6|nr:BatA and WFA domain-containing protein [Aureivirga marina]